MGERVLMAEGTIGQEDLDDLVAWLGTNPWLTQGPLVREFERRWADWLGVRHALFVNSGSSANLLMYWSLLTAGRLRNRKVVVPAVAWSTTVAPAVQLGFEPILCEADEATFGLDPDHLETLCRRHEPAAVIAVHVLGVPNRMEELLALRSCFGFVLMEDACAATGSRWDGRRVGTLGDLSSFSFFYGHHLSTIEGGMVCTDDDALHDVLLQVRSHGWGKDLPPAEEAALARRHGALEFNRPFTFYHPGFNVRSTDLNARLGLSQMKKLDAVVRRRTENHLLYQARFRAAPRFRIQENDRASICSIAFTALAESAAHRDEVAAALAGAGIETRPLGGGNMSRQPFWQARYGRTILPMADRIHATSFQLPNHALLGADDVARVCDVALGAAPATGRRKRPARARAGVRG
jgi:CDP-4-dehydro-6-deoxyglucose reductase, E1